MNIVYAIDKNVYKLALVSFASLLINNKKSDINLYILCRKLPEYIINQFEKLNKIHKFNMQIIEVNPKEFEGLPTLWLTVESWFRLKLAELLPAENKVLYLDCDTLIRGDISEIYNRDMQDKDVIVRRENISGMVEYLSLQSGWYFNSGVIICNLKNWREHELTKRLFETAYKKKDFLKFSDQDVFNLVCDASKISFNSGDVFLTWHSDKAKEHKIVHFIGPKPNNPACISIKKYKKEWWKYAKQTPVYYSLYFNYLPKLIFNIAKVNKKTVITILGIKISF